MVGDYPPFDYKLLTVVSNRLVADCANARQTAKKRGRQPVIYYRKQFQSGMVGALMSRPFLEWQIRRQVMALPNVQVIDEWYRRMVSTNGKDYAETLAVCLSP